jgi:photosystem II stability/assembly factor-like uncharacterized protein
VKNSFLKKTLLSFVLLAVSLTLFAGAKKEAKPPAPAISESLLNALKWRCIGPAIMGGRIDDFVVVERNPSVIYAATASGGVWKTVSNGVTWAPIFDDQTTSSIGDIAVAPSNPDVVWAGTGEANNRQSSSWGDGVFKSTDGGRTWKNMGLRDTHHIGRVIIHPANPDIVYVAALGHLWGPNKERGVFKTSDGGKTWTNTKFIDENTGFVDLAMDPQSPDTLYAAAYQRQRSAWGFNGGGTGSGLYKTTDGGETWVKLTAGLPEGVIGRIGLDIYRRDPRIVYALVEHPIGGIYRSDDKGLTWKKMSSTDPRPMYYSQVRIDPNNDQRIWALGAAMYYSEDGGKSFSTDLMRSIHTDHHGMWIDPSDSNHLLVGGDGGIEVSYDRGLTWDFINTLPLGQFYEVGFDMRRPYYVYGGLQDNGSWGGPSATLTNLGASNEDWFRIGGGDGFYAQVDPQDYNTVYAESQDGYLQRLDLRTGESKSVRPIPPDEKETYRFNWNSPVLVSPHDSKTLYFGGNKLFISRNRGDDWEATADLTTQTDREKLTLLGKPVDKAALSRHDGVSYYGTITAISESPLKLGLLWVGTDDGNLQVSRDAGKTWKNVTAKVPGVPKNTHVTRVAASAFEEGKAFVSFDGHRGNDFTPYVFVTGDFGETWKNIGAGLPSGGTVSVVREDPRNADVLLVGTERGALASFDAGANWVRLKSNLPMVPVDDIAIHPRDHDIIFGTHGRSIWVLDDATPLTRLNKEVLASPAVLFDVRDALLFSPYDKKGNVGDKFFVAENPPFGAILTYYLKEAAKTEAKLVILDADGKTVKEILAPKEAGLHRLAWDLRYGGSPGESVQMGPMSFRLGSDPLVIPGDYKVILKADGLEKSTTVKVVADPRQSASLETRRAQRDALLDLSTLIPVIGSADRVTSSLKKQLDDVKAVLKKTPGLPDSAGAAVDEVLKKLDALRMELLGDPTAGFEAMRSTVRGRLFMLNRTIAGYTEAPSARQLDQIRTLGQKVKDIAGRVNAVIDQDLPRLNKMMNDLNVPRIVPEAKIKY